MFKMSHVIYARTYFMYVLYIYNDPLWGFEVERRT